MCEHPLLSQSMGSSLYILGYSEPAVVGTTILFNCSESTTDELQRYTENLVMILYIIMLGMMTSTTLLFTINTNAHAHTF